jgi:hypothetical protein
VGKPQPNSTLVKALARAWRWEKLLDDGICTGWSIWPMPDINRSYVSRMLRLALLAPDIIERILDGRPTVGLPQLLRPFPVEWEKQQRQFS